MIDFLESLKQWSLQTAVIMGMLVQFRFSDKKTWNAFSAIVISSVFVSINLMPFIIDMLSYLLLKIGVTTDINFERFMYSFSSVISVEIIQIIIVLSPSFLENKIRLALGIKKEKED